MKLPPLLTEKVVQADSAARSERDRSFLIFAGVVLMAIALGFKSELLGPGQVCALARRGEARASRSSGDDPCPGPRGRLPRDRDPAFQPDPPAALDLHDHIPG